MSCGPRHRRWAPTVEAGTAGPTGRKSRELQRLFATSVATLPDGCQCPPRAHASRETARSADGRCQIHDATCQETARVSVEKLPQGILLVWRRHLDLTWIQNFLGGTGPRRGGPAHFRSPTARAARRRVRCNFCRSLRHAGNRSTSSSEGGVCENLPHHRKGAVGQLQGCPRMTS